MKGVPQPHHVWGGMIDLCEYETSVAVLYLPILPTKKGDLDVMNS
jgi:hypothetical protein